MADDPTTDFARPSLCPECHGNDPDACVTCITDAGVWIDGPEWTDEQHAAYARASMGEPNYPPASPGADAEPKT